MIDRKSTCDGYDFRNRSQILEIGRFRSEEANRMTRNGMKMGSQEIESKCNLIVKKWSLNIFYTTRKYVSTWHVIRIDHSFIIIKILTSSNTKKKKKKKKKFPTIVSHLRTWPYKYFIRSSSDRWGRVDRYIRL